MRPSAARPNVISLGLGTLSAIGQIAPRPVLPVHPPPSHRVPSCRTFAARCPHPSWHRDIVKAPVPPAPGPSLCNHDTAPRRGLRDRALPVK